MTAVRTITETRAYAKPDSQSAKLWERAQKLLPGGNTRTTVFMAPRPVYAAEGQGCWLTDVDGERRLDLLNNYTALMHGHAHPDVTEAATRRLARGASFPLPTPEEIDLAALIAERVASVEQVRFTNSGSEAVMMAIKAARGFTGRPRSPSSRAPITAPTTGRKSASARPRDVGSGRRAGEHRVLEGHAPSVLEEWSSCRSTDASWRRRGSRGGESASPPSSSIPCRTASA